MTSKAQKAIIAADQLRIKALEAELHDAHAQYASAIQWIVGARFASGDNGDRMLPDFILYLAAMKAENDQLKRFIFESGSKL